MGEGERVKRIEYVVTEGYWTLGGEHTEQFPYRWCVKTHIVLPTSVTPIIENKTTRRQHSAFIMSAKM